MNFKKISRFALAVALGSAMAFPALAKAEGSAATDQAQVSTGTQDPKVAAELAKAAEYEKKAAEQEAVIQEHEKMKEDYKRSHGINGKNEFLFTAMQKHCDAIIHDAGKLKADYEGFAQWHRMYAADLQGK